MKNLGTPSARFVLAMALIFFVLTAYSPSFYSKGQGKKTSNEELSALADKVLRDSAFQPIIEADISRSLAILKSPPVKKQRWEDLAKMQIRSQSEIEEIFSVFGFLGLGDFNKYAETLCYVGRKFNTDRMTKDDQEKFSYLLREKQQKYVVENNLIEAHLRKYAPPGPGGMPSECWKCVYDYRDCMMSVNPVLHWTTTTTTNSTTLNIYVTTSGGWSVMKTSYTNTMLSRPIIEHMVTSYSPTACHNVYRSCIGNCATP